MIDCIPPKLASWLLKHCGSPYHRESLAGDLIEQYREGRSRAWFWKQVVAAILIARWRVIRAMPWTAARRGLLRVLAETAAVLALVVIVDQVRRTHSLVGMVNRHFINILILLVTVAVIGFLTSIRPGTRQQTVFNAVLLAFGVAALGAGTLTWADTLRGDARHSPACVCSTE